MPYATAQGPMPQLRLRHPRDPGSQMITRVRVVDVLSESYHVVREYMIRLEKPDLADSRKPAKIADAARMTPEDFRRR